MKSDEALLRQFIARLQPRLDAEETVNRLLRAYGCVGSVWEADAPNLARLCGMSAASAQVVGLVPHLTRYIAREKVRHMRCLNRFSLAAKYLSSLYLGHFNESFYLLCLDQQGMLLNISRLQQGTLDEAPFYPRRILELVFSHNARAVVLSHNHPSGTAAFSPGDIQCTLDAMSLLVPLDVMVLDHILVADGKAYSMHGIRDFPEELFTLQHPGDPLIDGWMRGQEDNL